MKFVYRLQHKKIPKLNNLGSLITAALSHEDGLIHEEDEYDDIITGGVFVPEDMKSTISITPEGIIRNNRDWITANNCYLASFTGDNIMDPNLSSFGDKVNTIGKWTDDIDKNAFIYYVIVDTDIRKLIFSRPLEFGQPTDIFGVVNIIEDNGDMAYCSPDEGDVMFDNREEAEQYIKEQYDLFKPILKKYKPYVEE